MCLRRPGTRWRHLLVAVALSSATACDGGASVAPLPEMIAISDFSLTDQSGQDFHSGDLRGSVWIASLIFTTCPEICPVVTSHMANLHRRIRHDDVRFVSVTVDPAVDTPEVLAEYATRYRADTSRWSFLTGAPEDVVRVINLSFRLPVGERLERDDGRYDILHTGQLVLVDRRGVMRGMYETDGTDLRQLEADVERLRAEPR